jgi:hypothetical protein
VFSIVSFLLVSNQTKEKNMKIQTFFVVMLSLFAYGCTASDWNSDWNSRPISNYSIENDPTFVRTVYVRAGQPFIPQSYKAYDVTNEQPLDYSSVSPPPDVSYVQPGMPVILVPPGSTEPQRCTVLMPNSYGSQTSISQQPAYNPTQEPAYQPQPQQPSVIIVQPPQRHEYQPRERTCPTCGGAGKLMCPTCRGSLYLRMPCGSCSGSGRQTFNGVNQPCPMCRGTGRTRCSTCMYIDVPQGTIQCQNCNGTGKVTR